MTEDTRERLFYERHGWHHSAGLVSDAQLEELRAEAVRICAIPASFDQRGIVPNSEDRTDRIDPVIDLSDRFRELAYSEALQRRVRQLIGDPIRLMKDKFIAKTPGVRGYDAHQDFAYWQGLGLDASRTLTAAIFLDDATSTNGAIECTSSQHHALLTDPGRIADPEDKQLTGFTLIEAKAGDVLFIHSLTPHRSGPNRTAAPRRSLFFTFAADEREDLYRIYQEHDDRYHR